MKRPRIDYMRGSGPFLDLARQLPTLEYEGKLWTADFRLREFRFIVFGEMPEFIPFESDLGIELLRALAVQSS
ncbi:MAG: hypothetical protein OK422_04350 [Thaumarchaeota archaeon]|nr:hypothetical protein [Nitrososphaerota archaeon]